MGSEMPSTVQKRQVLLVSMPGDELARNLVELLRAARVDVLVAQTVGLAARADEYAICIVILRSGIWRTSPVITTAVRTNPPYMIPVLAEPMELPESTWATEAVSVGEPLSTTAHVLAAIIARELQRLPQGEHQATRPRVESKEQRIESSVPRLTTMRPRLYKRHLSVLYSYILVALIIILGIILLIYYMPR